MEQAQQLDYNIYKEYQIIQKIGKGTYGVVYKAKHKKTNRIIAIKKIIDAFQNVIDAKRTYRQINYLLQIDHPCIVKLQYLLNLHKKKILKESSTTRLAFSPFINKQQKGFITDKMFQKQINQQRHVYAVFQYMPTDLYQVLKCNELQSIQRKFIAYQLFQGVAFLHRSGLVHRDLKPMNILINCNNLQIKICDFGMARLKYSQTDTNNKQGVLTQYVASRWYRPPQILLGLSSCQEAIDIWSLGCILAQLILKSPLFPGKSTLDQLQLIFRCIGLPSEQQIQKLSSFGSQYVIRNFTFSKKSKFKSLQQTLSFCDDKQIDLLINLLKFDPQKRISAAEALNHPYFDEIKSMKMDVQFKKYQKYTAKIIQLNIDNTLQSQQRGSNKSLDVNHYRKLIQQLQKYGQRSTNRSQEFLKTHQQQLYNLSKQKQLNHIYQPVTQKIQLQSNIYKKQQQYQNKHVDFPQKSTKDSDLAHILIKKQVKQPTIKSQIISLHKNTSMNQIKNNPKDKKKKKNISKAKSLIKIVHNQISNKQKHIININKNNSQKQMIKNRESFHKNDQKNKNYDKESSLNLNKSKDQLKIKKVVGNYDLMRKKFNKQAIKDISQISYSKTNSIHKSSISKEKSKGKSHKLYTNNNNIGNIKMFSKPSSKLNKTVIAKVKSGGKIVKDFYRKDR